MTYKTVLFRILRDGEEVGTAIGLTNDLYPEVIAFADDAPIQPGDRFQEIRVLEEMEQ
jgi:hypothetical protein